MPKPNVEKKPTKKISKLKIFSWAGAILLVLYVIGLVNPVTGMQLQYPYYELFCGKKPVIALEFMTKTYYTPDQETYKKRLGIDGKLYCTEAEALSAGYQKNPSP